MRKLSCDSWRRARAFLETEARPVDRALDWILAKLEWQGVLTRENLGKLAAWERLER